MTTTSLVRNTYWRTTQNLYWNSDKWTLCRIVISSLIWKPFIPVTARKQAFICRDWSKTKTTHLYFLHFFFYLLFIRDNLDTLVKPLNHIHIFKLFIYFFIFKMFPLFNIMLKSKIIHAFETHAIWMSR